jgi:hypothetical protein
VHGADPDFGIPLHQCPAESHKTDETAWTPGTHDFISGAPHR